MKIVLLTAFALLCSMTAEASNVKKLTRAIKESNLELVQYLLKYKSFTVAQLDDAAQQGAKERAPLLASTVIIETAKFGFLLGASLTYSLTTLKDYLTGKLDRSADEWNMAVTQATLELLNEELNAGVNAGLTEPRRLEITQAVNDIDWWMKDLQRKKAHLATLRTFGMKSFLAGAAIAGVSCFFAIKAFYRGYNHGKLAWQVSREVAQARVKALLYENGKK